MDKRILEEYIDACEVIRETEAEIRKLEDKKSITANETVSGSNPEFPYNHSTSRYRERHILMQMTAGSGQRKRS